MLTDNPTEAGSGQFALWVAFFEIYNECVYDLLQPSLCSKSKKRASLRVCDDGAGNAYVKGVSLLGFFCLFFLSSLECRHVVAHNLKWNYNVCFCFRSEVD